MKYAGAHKGTCGTDELAWESWELGLAAFHGVADFSKAMVKF